MNGDTADLVCQLCTRIGMIMEDASVEALTIASRNEASRRAAITELEVAAARISGLLAAVSALSN